MNLAVESPAWLANGFAVLLVLAAIEDSVRLRISNLICLLILIGALIAMGIVGPQGALWQNFAVFAALLAIGTPLFAAGKLGGGDVKLLAVTALWFDLDGAWRMVIAVLLAGGVLAFVTLALRLLHWSEAAQRRVHVLRKGGGIPYGVAIAAGALIAIGLQREGVARPSPLPPSTPLEQFSSDR